LTFEVLLCPKAARALKKLQPSVRKRAIGLMKELSRTPEKGEQLKPSRFWRVRVGDYRVIYEVDRSSSKVVILFIGHRKDVYDEFSRLL